MEKLELEESIVCEYDEDCQSLDILAYVTDACNYNCWYCYRKCSSPMLLLDLRLLQDYISFVIDKTGRNIEAELIGGEPSCHPQIVQFCLSCQAQQVVLYTNYSLDLKLYESMCIGREGVKFDISYHEQDGKMNSKVIDNILHTPPNRIRGITVMLDKSFFSQQLVVYKMLREKLPDVDVDLLLVLLDGKVDSYSDLQLEQYYEASSKPSSTEKLFTAETSLGRKLHLTHNLLYELSKCKYTRWLCNAGEDLLYVHADGSVYCCDGYYFSLRKPLFNVKSKFLLPKKKTFCMASMCPFQDRVFKKKVFK